MTGWQAFAGLFAANFGFVFLKAFQQRNVAFLHYRWVMPVSLCMAVGEVFALWVIVEQGFALVTILGFGLGGGAGCLVAMYCHDRWVK